MALLARDGRWEEVGVASVQQCERALRSLADRLSAVDPELRARYVVPRTLACRVPDLDVVFLASLGDEGLDALDLLKLRTLL